MPQTVFRFSQGIRRNRSTTDHPSAKLQLLVSQPTLGGQLGNLPPGSNLDDPELLHTEIMTEFEGDLSRLTTDNVAFPPVQVH